MRAKGGGAGRATPGAGADRPVASRPFAGRGSFARGAPGARMGAVEGKERVWVGAQRRPAPPPLRCLCSRLSLAPAHWELGPALWRP